MSREGFSPEQRRPSEPLSQRAVRQLMDGFVERLFVHGENRLVRPAMAPREIQYDFSTKAVQLLLERVEHEEGLRVAEAYAVYEREDDANTTLQEAEGSSVVVIINKLLTASPANNPIFQNTWYTFTADQRGDVEARYAFEFLQGGRPVMDTAVATSLEERLFQAMRGSSDRHRQLFHDDEIFLRKLLDMIGR